MDSSIRERLMHTCAWCTRIIAPDEEAYGFGARAQVGIDLDDKEGEFVTLNLALQDKTVVALVTTADSTARAEGYDLMFITCSEECANELKDALELEIDVFD
jgi:hypothetical protein